MKSLEGGQYKHKVDTHLVAALYAKTRFFPSERGRDGDCEVLKIPSLASAIA